MWTTLEDAATALSTWDRVSCYCWHKPGLFIRLDWFDNGRLLCIAELTRSML